MLNKSYKSLMVGCNYPTKLDNINIGDGAFEGKLAAIESVTDVTKKVRLSNKAKKMIRKDEKLMAMYNRLERQFEVSDQEKKRKAKSAQKSKNKNYNRR